MELNCISWNINGLNSPQKRRKITHWLSKQKCSIICLQEVHIRNKDNKYLKQKVLGLEFSSLSTVKKRGVVMYIKKEMDPRKIWQDTDGGVLAVEVKLEQKKFLLVGVYAPNGAKERFFINLQNKLKEVRYDNIMLMGDFNAVSDTNIDKTSRKKGGKLPKSFF